MSDSEKIPWIQKLYDRIWLVALAALVFFFLSYALWGLSEIMMTPEG